MKTILNKQINEAYKWILFCEASGWGKHDLYMYTSGVGATLNNLLAEVYAKGVISLEEYEELDEVFTNTLDTLEY